MANPKNGSVVEYNGDLSGLVIKVNGEIVYSGKQKKPKESELMKKAQEDHSNTTKFARCVNSVPILQRIWKEKKRSKWATIDSLKMEVGKQSNFGKPSGFNKIISANKKLIRAFGKPISQNIILPESSAKFPYEYSGELNNEGVDIRLHIPGQEGKIIPDNSNIIPIGVFCFHNPKKEGKTKFEMISKYYEISDFSEADDYKIHFPMTADEIKTIKNYKSCIFYFAIGEPPRGAKRARGFRHSHGLEFEIENLLKKPIMFGTKSVAG